MIRSKVCAKKGKKWLKAGIAALAAVVLACSAAAPATVYASGSISEAQEKKKQLQKNLEEAEALIKKLKENKSDLESAVTELDNKMTGIENEISDLEKKIEETNAEIEETKAELEKAKEDERIQSEGMKIRIRFMYQNSGMSVLEALLSADSFADFLNQAEYFTRIMDYDREMLAKYQETRQKIADAEQVLEEDRKTLEESQAQMEEQKKAVNKLLEEKQNQLAALGSDLSDAQGDAASYKAKIAAENEIIAQIRAAESKAKDQGTSKNSYTGGVFTWPCPSSKRITSGFGKRNAPTAGASSYHNGIDIGASKGSAIVAAADGVVTVAGHNSGYGNYVTVSHGGGLSTIYCHCSSLLVSKGQKVSRGQTIAKVGSTGISTAPHLHFGVILNGSFVSPMKYL